MPALGLRENWPQFWLLVLINAFVGAMVGLERTVLPLLAEREFGLASKSAALSFIVTFGIVKAITNFFAGRLGDRFGRLRLLFIATLIFGLFHGFGLATKILDYKGSPDGLIFNLFS